jgi:hypothetical protein
MNRAFRRILLAVLPLEFLMTAFSACLAWDGWSCCPHCCTTDCCVCRWCDAICDYRVIEGSTHCAWRRTWYGPYAPATPLRQYYIPRPPECSNCNGYAGGYVLGNFPAPDRNVVVSPAVSPQAYEGFAPVQYERLGKIHNELDVAGPLSGPPTSRGVPSAR